MSAKKRRSDLDRTAVFEAILGDLGGNEGEATLGSVALEDIRFNRRQPRKYVDDAALEELAASVRDKGVLEPIIVRKAAEGYELVAGERRTRAAIKVGLSEIPAIVVDIDDREALEVSIMENLQREDLNAVEETDAVLSLLELSLDASRDDAVALLQEMYNEERGRTPEGAFSGRQKHVASALFRRLGRFTPSSFVANRIPILSFPPELLEVVRQGKLAFTKAQAIARLEEEPARRLLLEEALEEGLSLSQIRRRITQLRRGAPTLERGPAGPTIELAGTTKRLLNRRKLASLDAATLSRVSDLLRELRAALED